MSTQMRVVWLALLTLLVCSIASGGQAPKPIAEPAPVTAAAPRPPADEEVKALRAQLEVMWRYDQRLLYTVYWALGGLGTVVIAIIGFGWFANFRLYERDKAALKAELENAINQQANTLRDQLDTKLRQIEGVAFMAAKESAESAVKPLRGTIEALRRELMYVEYKLEIGEAEDWKRRGVPVNALRDYRRALEIGGKLGMRFCINQSLEGIQAALKAGARPDSGDTAELTATLNALDPTYAVDAEAIRALLARSKGTSA